MATSITHADITPMLGILPAVTTWDGDFDTVCTAVGSAVDAAVGAVFLAANAALVKEAAICIAAGKCWLGMVNRPGYAEALDVGGIKISALDKGGAVDLIKTGWGMLKLGIDSAKVENAADLPQESHSYEADTFPPDSVEYSYGYGS